MTKNQIKAVITEFGDKLSGTEEQYLVMLCERIRELSIKEVRTKLFALANGAMQAERGGDWADFFAGMQVDGIQTRANQKHANQAYLAEYETNCQKMEVGLEESSLNPHS